MHSSWFTAIVALLPMALANPEPFTPAPVTTKTSTKKITTTTTKKPTSTCTQTICADYINSCGQMYGGCYPACKGYTTPKFSDPGCPTTTSKPPKVSTIKTTSASCPYICKDYFDACGNTYGPGCYTSCPGKPEPTYTTPSCVPTTTIRISTITSTSKKPCSTSSCPFVCRDYFDQCGNTYGPGCYTACPGKPEPTYTTPSCSLTSPPAVTPPTTKITSKPGCGYICQDYVDKCGNTYGPGCYTSCSGKPTPKFTTPKCTATGKV